MYHHLFLFLMVYLMNNIYQVLNLLHLYYLFQERNLSHIDEMILSLLYLLHKMLIIHHHHDGRLHLSIEHVYDILIIIILRELYHLYSKNLMLNIFQHDGDHLPNLLRYLHRCLEGHRLRRLNHHRIIDKININR